MDNVRFALDAAGRSCSPAWCSVPACRRVFALGIRSLAWGTGGAAEVEPQQGPHPVGRVLAAVCFAVVVAGVALGITFIVASGFGKALSFEHVYPTLIDKE